MRIDPLMTANPVTGAVRFVTDNLLGETYLAPMSGERTLTDALKDRDAPWSESFEAAPTETARAVEAGLTAVARATRTLDPAEIDLSELPECRARTHLSALKALWQDLGRLPDPLAIWAHVIGSEGRDALEPLPVLDPTPCPHADPAEAALLEALAHHHGTAASAALSRWQQRQAPMGRTASGRFGAIQEQLGGASTEPGACDDTVSCFGLRDPHEEARFAAARAQRMLDEGRVGHPADIGLLVPDDPAYVTALSESLDRLGLPLSGAPGIAACRDVTGELVSLLLELMSAPAPRMALASCYISPLMPWSRETGRQMAREVMDKGWSRTASAMSGTQKDMLEALRPAQTAGQLFARLGLVDKAVTKADLQPRIAALRAAAQEGLDWRRLSKLATPQPVAASGPDRFVEGVSLFTQTALPWRPVRQLVVLGMTGPHWPRSPGSDPFFSEAEIAMIRERTGLQLKGRREKLARGLELFRRQLCAGAEGLTLLAPARTLRGDPLSPSTGLALISHMLGAESPRDLVRDVRSVPPEDWPVSTHVPTPVPGGGAPALPHDGVLHLNRGLGTPDKPGLDLLRLRLDDDGRMAPQSPSRLENLIVSPLAWLLEELKAKDRTWAPEALDIQTLGTIIHQVLEDAFPENMPVPTTAALDAAIPDILEHAIRTHARWLANQSWATERQSLLVEALDVARTWAGFLNETGAVILHNEVALAGEHGGVALRGKADCLLRLPDGRILVVDHKRSSAHGRRNRMGKGWDLQVALYRAMLERPREETALTRLVEDGARIVTAYHTTNDATVLADELGTGLVRVEAALRDVSENAISHLAETLAEVGAGEVRLNRQGDATRFKKERGITAYALDDNPLVAAFTLPEEDMT